MNDEHTSKSIIGSLGSELAGKRIVLAISGSVACVKAVDIARELMRHGATVYPVMSKSAANMISPSLLEWATGEKCVTELTGAVEHVHYCGAHSRKADMLLIAPSTSNTISKIACGIDDTAVTTFAATALGTGVPVMIVPAMHVSMYENPFVRENISKLRGAGVTVIDPEMRGTKARLRSVDEIVRYVINFFTTKDLSGKKVVITGGPTIEYVDPVRVITNRGSGTTGKYLAENAVARGAKVVFVAGYGVDVGPADYDVVRADTTEDMFNTLKGLVKDADVLIHSAAVSDFSPDKSDSKISTVNDELVLKMKPTPKILDGMRALNSRVFLVGFKAEYGVPREKLVSSAKKKLEDAKADMIVANDVAIGGMGTDLNQVLIVDKNGVSEIPRMHKKELASRILDEVVSRIH